MNTTDNNRAIAVVIDTNVVLDLWLFKRSGLDALHACFEHLTVIGTTAMREELRAVLHHSAAGNGPVASGHLSPDAATTTLASWDRHVRIVEAPSPQRGPAWPRCRDESDQKFIDLALAQHAGWLLTRDRALLKLARRCRAYGLLIVVPESATFAST